MKTLNLKIMKTIILGVAIAMLVGSSAMANRSTEVDINSVIVEENETLDNWMTDLSSWNSLKLATVEVDTEEELELETWMINLDSEVWCSDQEKEMEIEDWMTRINNNWITEEMEEDLTLEVWMLNPEEWLD